MKEVLKSMGLIPGGPGTGPPGFRTESKMKLKTKYPAMLKPQGLLRFPVQVIGFPIGNFQSYF